MNSRSDGGAPKNPNEDLSLGPRMPGAGLRVINIGSACRLRDLHPNHVPVEPRKRWDKNEFGVFDLGTGDSGLGDKSQSTI